jgi:hypothetical protein
MRVRTAFTFRGFGFLLICGLCAATCLPKSAQFEKLPPANAEIRGIVQDGAKQTVAGADIHVRDLETKASYTSSSGEDGSFVIEKLQPGAYEVCAAKKPLPKSAVAKFELSAGQSFELELSLAPPPKATAFLKRLAAAYAADWKGGAKK